MAGTWFFSQNYLFLQILKVRIVILEIRADPNWFDFLIFLSLLITSLNNGIHVVKGSRIDDLKSFIVHILLSTKQIVLFNILYILILFLHFDLSFFFSGQHFRQQNFQRKPWPAGFGNYCRFVLYKENMDTMEAVHKLTKFFQ